VEVLSDVSSTLTTFTKKGNDHCLSWVCGHYFFYVRWSRTHVRERASGAGLPMEFSKKIGCQTLAAEQIGCYENKIEQ